ncbi:iron-siderophore ABC transporter substrate-binding protein [Paraburkholderia acidisoli]|uniref:ABC transporter substrate-binding protein n=1 Tax=Paraburkholderia acidisoli TaxID=2571748 RepID=A0A7Z2JIS7_9BURK|nr:iron-siderophore ABC transporter substrate-binding protein [Paraburkholderia acidisoli]QGZ64674.1 ABC transporter substrate-binding protein [Paraburkholderia acidisoli]
MKRRSLVGALAATPLFAPLCSPLAMAFAASCGSAWAAAGANPHAAARTAVPRRVIVLDWGLAELVLALGVVPVGMANTAGFRRNFPACAVPDSVVDLGLMFQPNMELMLALAPDLIVITPAHASMRGTLERLAPTVTLGMFRASAAPYTAACDETMRLARLFGREAQGEAAVAQSRNAIDAARARLAALPSGFVARDVPIYLARFIDESHLRVFGAHSLFGELLARLGLRNAWGGAPRAASAIIGFDALDADSRATLVYLKPLPALSATMMQTSRVWQAMPFARAGRMTGMAEAPPEGGILSAAYFATALVEALAALPSSNAAKLS